MYTENVITFILYVYKYYNCKTQLLIVDYCAAGRIISQTDTKHNQYQVLKFLMFTAATVWFNNLIKLYFLLMFILY